MVLQNKLNFYLGGLPLEIIMHIAVVNFLEIKAGEIYDKNIKTEGKLQYNVYFTFFNCFQIKDSFYNTLDIIPNGIVIIDMKTKEPLYANQEIDSILFEENDPKKDTFGDLK